MRNRSILKSAAPSLLLLLGSCELAEPVQEPQERSFAPRILEAPQSHQIRLEVAQFSLDGWSGAPPNNAFYRNTTVFYSAGRIRMDGLPSDRTLYFRVSGLDIQGAAIWTIPGGVPNEGSSPSLSIGYDTPYFPRSIAMPGIGWTTDQLLPRIECWNSSWPAWTTDGSLPGPQNPSTASSKNLATTSVQLSPGQKLTARCTDGSLWSYANTYDAPTAISPPNPTGPNNDFYLQPNLEIPYTNSGTITFSANTSSFSGYTNWKVAYQFNSQSSTGWSIADLGASGVPFSGSSGTIHAYLMAWSQSQSRWMTGQLATATYPAEPYFSGIVPAGGPIPTPEIVLPTTFGGYARFTYDTAGYSHCKIVVQYGASSPAYFDLRDHEEYLSGSGSLTVYLIGWNGTDWVSSPSTTAYYPPGATLPDPTGPGVDLPKIDINAPTSNSGYVSFRNPGTSTGYENWTVAYRLYPTASWQTVDLASTGVWVGGTGTIQAYLMAWDATQKRWLSGPSASVDYPAKPALPNPLPEPDYTFGAPTINPPAALPGLVSFYNPNISLPNYSDWKVLYRIGDTGSLRAMGIDSSFMMKEPGEVKAYLMAWNTSTGGWATGYQANAFIGQSPAHFVVVPYGGPLPVVTILGESSTPSTARFQFTPPSEGTYSKWKIVYQLSGATSWSSIDSGNGVAIPSASTITAYLEAWSETAKQWVSGPASSLAIPVPITVEPPVFLDGDGTVLGATWEQDGITIPLRIAGSGTIYYTTDGSTPYPNSTYTSVWSAGQLKMSFPLSLESMNIRAMAVVNGTQSSVSSITVNRPLWDLKTDQVAGCLRSDGQIVLACGDESGPWIFDALQEKWLPVATSWSEGNVATILLNSTEAVFATDLGKVVLLDRTGGTTDLYLLGSDASLGTIGGLAILHDTLWASTSNGPKYYDVLLDDWFSPAGVSTYSFGAPGPAFAQDSTLWMAFGQYLWRYGTAIAGYPDGWNSWGSIGSNISLIQPDPFAATGLCVGYVYGLYQVNTTSPGFTSNYMYTSNSSAPTQLVTLNAAAFVATDNGSGEGGVMRSTAWGTYLNPFQRAWPSVGGRTISAQGLVQFADGDSRWLMASTQQGTYMLRLR